MYIMYNIHVHVHVSGYADFWKLDFKQKTNTQQIIQFQSLFVLWIIAGFISYMYDVSQLAFDMVMHTVQWNGMLASWLLTWPCILYNEWNV